MFRLMLSLVLFFSFNLPLSAKTRKDAATLTRSYGKVQMLLNPSKKKEGLLLTPYITADTIMLKKLKKE